MVERFRRGLASLIVSFNKRLFAPDVFPPQVSETTRLAALSSLIFVGQNLKNRSPKCGFRLRSNSPERKLSDKSTISAFRVKCSVINFDCRRFAVPHGARVVLTIGILRLGES